MATVTSPFNVARNMCMDAAACALFRYRDKVSQKAAWEAGHREECKALRCIAPGLPPLTVRMAARVLWRRARCRFRVSETCQQRATQLLACIDETQAGCVGSHKRAPALLAD